MPLNLLVIDDDPAVTELLAVLLSSHGFEVATSNNSPEAVKQIRENAPDLLILDLMMPGLDGWAVCKEIRTFSSVPILILSALNHPGMIASILDSGADDFLTKPTISSVLVAHINRLVKRSAAGIPAPISPGRAPLGGKTRPLPP